MGTIIIILLLNWQAEWAHTRGLAINNIINESSAMGIDGEMKINANMLSHHLWTAQGKQSSISHLN